MTVNFKTMRDFRRTESAVLRVERMQRDDRPPMSRQPNGDSVYIAKVTGAGASAGYYEATEQIWDDSAGTWVDNADGNVFDLTSAGVGEVYEITGSSSVATDTIIIIVPFGGDESDQHWGFAQGGGGTTVVPVKITSGPDGGGVYTVDVYADGPDSASTTTGADMKLIQIESTQDVPDDTFLMATLIGSTYWADVPRFL